MLLARFVVGVVSVSLIILGADVVSGQDYPNKPIRILTAAAGGGGDVVARLIAQGISGPLGQPVIVDNRGGIIPIEVVSKAPPDGYTVLVIGGRFTIAPLLEKTPYDPVTDFSPISLVSRQVSVLVVHPSLPVKSVKELIALARARPGDLNYAAGATGGSHHLAAELFKSMASVNIVRISYKGTGPALIDVIAGQVQIVFPPAGVTAPHVKSGKLRALAVTSATPSALAPGLPTVAASGLPGYELAGITGIFAPAKTPGAIINRLNQEIVRVLNRSDAKERFLTAGEEIVASSPEQFAATIRSDLVRMGKVIKDAGIQVE